MTTFRLVDGKSYDLNGITIMGEVEVVPADVVRCFGKPSPGDGYKISGEFVFTNDRGEVFVLHDWLSTKLYYGEGLSPVEFWALTLPQELNISSLDLNTTQFANWLQEQLRPLADGRIIYL
jgi:hypothetical protein